MANKEKLLAKKNAKQAKKAVRSKNVGQFEKYGITTPRVIFGLVSIYCLFTFGLKGASKVQKKAKAPPAHDASAAFHGGEHVVKLYDDNFEEATKDKQLSLVKFFAPWCGHCKSIAPAWSQAATKLSSNDNVIMGSVDCQGEGTREICRKFNITGYPTMKGFENGVEFEDENIGKARDIDAILKYVRDRVEIDALPDIKSYSDIVDTTVVGIHGSDDGGDKLENAFNLFADKLDMTYNFARIEDDTVSDAFKISVYKNGKELASFDSSEITEETTEEDAEKSVSTFAFKHLFTEQGPVVYSNQVEHLGYPNLLILSDDLSEHADLAKKLDSSARRVAVGLRDNYINVLGKFDLKEQMGGKNPTVIAMDNPSEAYIAEFSTSKLASLFGSAESTISTFLANVNSGKLDMWMKSEKIPKEAKAGEVVTIVGKTVKPIVFDTSKDVLLEIYAPWCGHCKKLDPEYKQLAEKLAGSEDIVIAKIDGTANSLPHSLSYTGFPTMYWIHQDTNEIEKVHGYDLSALLKMTVKHAKNKPDVKIPVKSEEVPQVAKAGEVVTLVGNNFRQIVNGEKDMFIKFYAPWCGHCKTMAEPWKAFAAEMGDEFDTLAIAEIDATANEAPEEFEYKGFPTLFWVPKGGVVPVKYEGGRDKAAWTKYVVENASGLSKEYEIPVKSEPVPEEQGAGEVITLVGKNFNKIVTEDKNLLIKFYAPWCGHCKSMMPAYIELAKEMEGEDVIIAEIDATMNESPTTYAYSGFPTMFWKPAGSNVPEKYESGRDFASMSGFIREKLLGDSPQKDEPEKDEL